MKTNSKMLDLGPTISISGLRKSRPTYIAVYKIPTLNIKVQVA